MDITIAINRNFSLINVELFSENYKHPTHIYCAHLLVNHVGEVIYKVLRGSTGQVIENKYWAFHTFILNYFQI